MIPRPVKLAFFCVMAIMQFFIFPSFCYGIDAATSGNDIAKDGKQEEFYSDTRRGKEGFYGYEPLKKKEKEEEKKNKQKEEKAAYPDMNKRMPDLKDYTVKELWDMYPDDFQALVTAFQKKAVTTKSESDVQDYWTMVDIARRRGMAFANVTAEVMQTNPSLNVQKDYPMVAPGRNATVRMQNSSVEDEIRYASDDYAILFFYRQGCEYCAAQEKINKMFVNKYGWEVKGIDGEANPGLKAEFNVDFYPTMYLVYKNSPEKIVITSGVTSMDDMTINIYRGMRLLKGETVPEDFASYGFEKGGSMDSLMPENNGQFKAD